MNELTQELQEKTAADEFAKECMENPNEQDFKEEDGLLWFEERIYIPKTMREPLLKEIHGSLIHGHFGREKTLARLSERYFFPSMRRFVEEFVAKCDICKRAKHE